MRFDEYRIAPEIKKSLEKMGFKRPTDIQYKAIPSILNGEDVLAIAQTGTGKTAAFAIPLLHLIGQRKAKSRQQHIRALVMVPTRELALQITKQFHDIGRFTKVRTTAIVGGMDQDPQIAQLEKGTDVLVATPGRMFDLVSQGHIKIDQIEHLVLDEADHMLDLGFIKDIRQLMHFLPKKRQTLFFSATIDKKIKDLAYSLVRHAIRIQISPKDPVSKNVEHSVAKIEMDDKRFFLERIVRENPKSKILVFVRTQVRAERVAKAMGRVNIEAHTLHGGKEQKDRYSVLNSFTNGNFKVLVCTDVAARGIDIPNVEYVVNYDIPDVPENYVHRVGRTGRGTAKGTAISFCAKEEEDMLTAVEDYMVKEIHVVEINKADYADTLDFSVEKKEDLDALLREVEEFENTTKVMKAKTLKRKIRKKGGKKK